MDSSASVLTAQRRVSRFLPALGLFSVVLSTGCTPRERELRGEGFRYIAREDDPVDGEILETLGRHRRAVEAFLKLDSKAIGDVTYHKFRDRQDLRRRGHCSASSSACYFRQWGVEAHTPLDAHELVHAYLAHWGDSHRLLEEGMARALACDRFLPQKVDFDAQYAFSRDAWASVEVAQVERLYAAGARFVAHVIDASGVERFRSFYTQTRPADEHAQVSATFARVYARELDHEWQRANTVERVDDGCLYAYECSWPALARDKTVGRHTRGTLTIEGDEVLHFTAGADDPWRLGACHARGALPYEGERLHSTGMVRGDEHWLALSGGTYWVDTGRSRLERVSASEVFVPAEQCSTATPIDVSAGRELFFALSSDAVQEMTHGAGATVDGPADFVLRLALGSSATQRATMECSDTARVEVCTACDYMQCQPACDPRRAPSLLLSDGAVLKVTSKPAANVWFRLRKGNTPKANRVE